MAGSLGHAPLGRALAVTGHQSSEFPAFYFTHLPNIALL